jgi:hypothetical protein
LWATIRFNDSPTLNIGSIATSVIIRGNGASNKILTNPSLNKWLLNVVAIFHGSSNLEFVKLESSVHANHIAVNPRATGTTVVPIALYTGGNNLDIVDKTSENIWQDQQLEKNSSAPFVSSVVTDR